MNTYRDRPKGEFIHESSWEELYALTKHWKSDLEFYKEDLRFLQRLIDKYFIWITTNENTSRVGEIQLSLLKVNKNCMDLLAKVGKHLIQLGQLIDDPNLDTARVFKIEHEHLEDAIATFVKSFRENRREVFRITEYIVDSEQLARVFES